MDTIRSDKYKKEVCLEVTAVTLCLGGNERIHSYVSYAMAQKPCLRHDVMLSGVRRQNPLSPRNSVKPRPASYNGGQRRASDRKATGLAFHVGSGRGRGATWGRGKLASNASSWSAVWVRNKRSISRISGRSILSMIGELLSPSPVERSVCWWERGRLSSLGNYYGFAAASLGRISLGMACFWRKPLFADRILKKFFFFSCVVWMAWVGPPPPKIVYPLNVLLTSV